MPVGVLADAGLGDRCVGAHRSMLGPTGWLRAENTAPCAARDRRGAAGTVAVVHPTVRV